MRSRTDYGFIKGEIVGDHYIHTSEYFGELCERPDRGSPPARLHLGDAMNGGGPGVPCDRWIQGETDVPFLPSVEGATVRCEFVDPPAELKDGGPVPSKGNRREAVAGETVGLRVQKKNANRCGHRVRPPWNPGAFYFNFVSSHQNKMTLLSIRMARRHSRRAARRQTRKVRKSHRRQQKQKQSRKQRQSRRQQQQQKQKQQQGGFRFF